MTVAELLDRISSDELTEWIAYSKIEPFGGKWEDHRAAQICSTVANFAGKTLRENTSVGPFDFFMTLAEPPDEPVALDDPEKQSNLLMHHLFGTNMEKEYG